MKKIILLACLALFKLNNFAQNNKYIPFPSRMITYVYVESANSSGNQSYYTNRFEIQGDTLINGLHYSLWLNSSTQSGNFITNVVGGIRNDVAAKKVYAYLFDTNKEELLYDFDLHVGDTLFKDKGYKFYRSLLSGQKWNGIDTVWVSRIDSVLMPHDGLYHKRFNFQAKFDNYSNGKKHYLITSDSLCVLMDGNQYTGRIKMNPLIEGAGPEFDIVTRYSPFEGLYQPNLVCRSIDGKTVKAFDNIGGNPLISKIYCEPIAVGIDEEQTEASVSIYPNPSSGKFKVVLNSIGPAFFEISNMLGVKILSSVIVNKESEIELPVYAAGIYFIRLYDKNGEFITKKIIVN